MYAPVTSWNLKYMARIASSISTDPASVYRKNLIAAYKPPVASPYANQEVHRNQRHFPENVEQHEIERHEDAEHPGLKQKEQNVIFLFRVFEWRTTKRESKSHRE